MIVVAASDLTRHHLGAEATLTIAGVTLTGMLTSLQTDPIRVGIRDGGTTYLELRPTDQLTIEGKSE